MLETIKRITDVTEVNVNKDERWASLAGGAVLLLYAMIRVPLSAVLALGIAIYLFFRGIRGFCYIYDRLSVNRAVDRPISLNGELDNIRESSVLVQ